MGLKKQYHQVEGRLKILKFGIFNIILTILDIASDISTAVELFT